jgi:peptidoglycan/LPS O-acetylase OafA/YrhL
LRGIAAIGVVALHFPALFAPFAVPSGYLAVDLFFMMSGVVIAHAYDRRFRTGMSTREFILARFVRLYPLYLLGTFLGLLVAVAGIDGGSGVKWNSASTLLTVLLAASFLPDLSRRPNDWLFPLNIPCWSLFFEILVNFAYRALWSTLNLRRLLLLCLASGVGVAVTIAIWGHIDQGSTGTRLLPGIVRTIFGFSVGVLIARTLGNAPRTKSTPLCLAICATVIIAIVGRPHAISRAVWDASCVLLVFPLVVCAGTRIDPPSWLRPAATFLGLTSYAIYVLHGPSSKILLALVHRLSHGSASRAAPYAGVLLLAVLLSASWLIDRHYDVPVRRAMGRLFRFPGRRPVATLPQQPAAIPS